MSAETLLRHWKTLQLVPKFPRRASAKQICSQLKAHGFRATERTVQRDLEKLSATFPLSCDNRSKPYGWFWDRDSQLLQIPGMDPATALTFHFVSQYVEPLLPATVRNNLAPHLEAATRVLDSCTDNALPRWPDKIVVIPQGQRLEGPRIDRAIMDTVYDAVLRDRQLHMLYRARSQESQLKEYTVHPLGLVLRNHLCYLVGTLFDYTDVVQLALHRIEKAEVLEQASQRPPGFSLKDYVAEGSFDYPIGERIRLVATFDRATAHHLAESPLSADQQLKPEGDTRVRVSATVRDTQQLRWWLLGFGDQVVVEQPDDLRTAFARIFRNLANHYSG
jgi:hypothetical protein